MSGERREAEGEERGFHLSLRENKMEGPWCAGTARDARAAYVFLAGAKMD